MEHAAHSDEHNNHDCLTREKLMETAIDLIWRSNYEGVGVSEICERTGVTKGSFYHHFQSKAELFYAASAHFWVRMKADLDRIFSPENKPLERLEAFIQFILAKQTRERRGDNPVSGCPFFTAGAQVGMEQELVQKASVEMSDKAVRYCEQLVRDLESGGYLEDTISDAGQVGRLIHEFIQGVLIYGRVHRNLDLVSTDIRTGIYRLLAVKSKFRK